MTAGGGERRTPEPESGWAEAFIEKTVGEVMVTRPKSLPGDATVGEVMDVFDDDHVHMVLLVEGGILRGTLERPDLTAALRSDSAPERHSMGRPALPLASLSGRTVPSTMPVLTAWELLLARRSRRSAVVDERGALLGLLCLKRRLTGFCSDADVAARAVGRGSHATPSRVPG
jgi:CBS domain containing-hemolysin-like protein